METITVLAVGFVCVACFLAGARVGQAAQRGEKIETPSINPLKAYREQQSLKEAERENDRLGTILANIDAYDGTGRGQKDVPKG